MRHLLDHEPLNPSVFLSELSSDKSYKLFPDCAGADGANMKTYEISIETIDTADDTMEPEEADPGWEEPVVFNQTDNQTFCQLGPNLPMTPGRGESSGGRLKHFIPFCHSPA